MPQIQPIKVNYDHSRLVNTPPFITNFPLIEPKEQVKREFIAIEKERIQKEITKQKATNAFIWTWLLGTLAGAIATTIYLYKKIKAALF